MSAVVDLSSYVPGTSFEAYYQSPSHPYIAVVTDLQIKLRVVSLFALRAMNTLDFLLQRNEDLLSLIPAQISLNDSEIVLNGVEVTDDSITLKC